MACTTGMSRGRYPGVTNPGRVLLTALCLVLGSCASSDQQRVEQIEFHLDQGEWDQARTLAQEGLARNPDSSDYRQLFGRAAVAEAVLAEGGTFLTLFAELLEPIAGTESSTGTFLRLSEDIRWDSVALLFAGRDSLVSIPEADRDLDVCLDTYFARVFEIAAILTVTTRVEAGAPCLVPADFTADVTARFVEDLRNAPLDRICAGLMADEVEQRVQTMDQAVASAQETAPDEQTAVLSFVRSDLGNAPDCKE